MFNREKFYEQAHAGRKVEEEELIKYISSFNNIILWGAGNLGSAVGKKLLECGVNLTVYWDRNYQEKQFCNNVVVKEPFSTEYNREDSLIISCIVNGSLGSRWTERELEKRNYHNYLSGMAIYEGIVCPLGNDNFDITECTKRKACSLCNCEKYTSLLEKKINQASALTFQLMTFIISTRCTLNCKYCGQRLSEYAPEDRVDFPLDNIIRDIDNFLGAVDFVGMLSIIGGEPFIHPHLEQIISHCLTKKNFGVVNITTNGIVKITEELLSKIKSDRVKISFSIYDNFLTEKQKNLLERNIDIVQKSGISYSLSYPLWVKPQELCDYGHTEELMNLKRKNCDSIKMCAAIRDGIFCPCSIAENILSLHKFTEEKSFVDVKNPQQLRERLIECLNLPFFEACRFCGNGKAEEILAGEQV